MEIVRGGDTYERIDPIELRREWNILESSHHDEVRRASYRWWVSPNHWNLRSEQCPSRFEGNKNILKPKAKSGEATRYKARQPWHLP